MGSNLMVLSRPRVALHCSPKANSIQVEFYWLVFLSAYLFSVLS